jgi:hypothetical protein
MNTEKKKMRAILIDPEKRALTEIRIGKDIGEIYAALQCEQFTTGAYLNGSLLKGFDSILVSDDYLDEGDKARFWFQVDADRNPPSSHPITGFGLALGADPNGESCDVRISMDDLAKRITYTQRKFRGFTSETFEPGTRADGLILKVETVAPIIDGTEEVAINKSRPASWNAKMLSGKPLITDGQFKRLLANAPQTLDDLDIDPIPVVKIFLPHVRWLLGWIYPHNHDRAFAVMKWGNKEPEIGDVLLSSIVASRLGTLMPERDLYITLDKSLSHYMQHPDIW